MNRKSAKTVKASRKAVEQGDYLPPLDPEQTVLRQLK